MSDPGEGPLMPHRTSDEFDVGWGDDRDGTEDDQALRDDQRLRDEVPPHHTERD
jgi:hypothetical protein